MAGLTLGLQAACPLLRPSYIKSSPDSLADHAALEFNSGSDAVVDVVVPDEAGRTAEVETE